MGRGNISTCWRWIGSSSTPHQSLPSLRKMRQAKSRPGRCSAYKTLDGTELESHYTAFHINEALTTSGQVIPPCDHVVANDGLPPKKSACLPRNARSSPSGDCRKINLCHEGEVTKVSTTSTQLLSEMWVKALFHWFNLLSTCSTLRYNYFGHTVGILKIHPHI